MRVDKVAFDLYFCILNVLCSLIGLRFLCRYMEVRAKKFAFLLYSLFLLVWSGVEYVFRFPPVLDMAAGWAGLFLTCAFLLKVPWTMAVLSSTLTVTVSYLTNGLCGALTDLSIRLVMPPPWLGILLSLLSGLLGLAWMGTTYRMIEKRFRLEKQYFQELGGILFLPVFLILLIAQFVPEAVHGNPVVIRVPMSLHNVNRGYWEGMMIQIVAYLGLLAVLFGYTKAVEGLRASTKVALLEQQAHVQHAYMEEARSRYEQTRSFRHDLNNHLVVLDGLLQREDLQRARAYVEELEQKSQELSFSCYTGNPSVDVLLSLKLQTAGQEGIRVECAVRLPQAESLGDMDLCILFANAADNAIRACREVPVKERYIRIEGKQKGGFLLLDFENPEGTDEKPFEEGIGISNMRAIAQKYNGTLSIERGMGFFRLSILLLLKGCGQPAEGWSNVQNK